MGVNTFDHALSRFHCHSNWFVSDRHIETLNFYYKQSAPLQTMHRGNSIRQIQVNPDDHLYNSVICNELFVIKHTMCI